MKNLFFTVILLFGINFYFGFFSGVFAQESLNEKNIMDILVGNSMKLSDFRTGDPVTIFIAPDGTFRSLFHGKYSEGKWWINEDSLFCRQYKISSRKRCSKVSVKGDRLTFHLNNGKSYSAKLLSGDRLP